MKKLKKKVQKFRKLRQKRKLRKQTKFERGNIKQNEEPKELVRAPHSFVIHRGDVGIHVQDLTTDFRLVMEPFTASSLKAKKYNSIKDFASISGIFHVTHLCEFTQTDIGIYLKIARLTRGPTLFFRVHNFSLTKDIRSHLKTLFYHESQFKYSPLVVMNNFAGQGKHVDLASSTFQNMFPTINVTKVDLNKIKRVAMFNYNPETKLIDFRHYSIRIVPVGISKAVKKVIQRKIPDLSKYEDISDFVTKSAQLSDSEFEDDPANHVTLTQDMNSRGNLANNKSSIRLCELGPRLTLQLIKIEEGLMEGEVLYHDIVHKSMEEKLLLKKRNHEKRIEKKRRIEIQEINRKRNEEKKKILKEKSLKGMQNKKKEETEMKEEEVVDDDIEWYKKEVGQEPDKDLFSTSQNVNVGKAEKGRKRKRESKNEVKGVKKLKQDQDEMSKKNFKSKPFKSNINKKYVSKKEKKRKENRKRSLKKRRDKHAVKNLPKMPRKKKPNL